MEAFNMQLLRFFDWLLWTTIQGSILIVLIVLIQKILRRRLPIRWHYFVWTLLLIRLAIPWLPESRVSIFNLIPRRTDNRILLAIAKR
jgi:bla regulator protein BlaR1